MIVAEFGTGQVVWSFLWFSLFLLWFALVVIMFAHIARSNTLSGWGKAAWALIIIVLPFLGVLAYMVVNDIHDGDPVDPWPQGSSGPGSGR